MRTFAIIFFGILATSLGSDSSSYETDYYDSYDYDDYEAGEIEERVASGREIDWFEYGKFKYQVGMFSYNYDKNVTLCGGVLVHPEVVLTAAHCVENTIALGVFMGTRVKPKSITSPGNKFVPREFIVIHEDYGHGIYSEDDIAIVFLPEPAVLGLYIDTIPIAKGSSNCASGTAWVSGWGIQTDEVNSQTSDILNYVKVNAASSKNCKNYFGDYFAPDKQICTYDIGAVGVCKGDSGGPIVFEDNYGRRVLCGLTSFGESKCESQHPRVYTSIAYYCDNGWLCRNSRYLVGCN